MNRGSWSAAEVFDGLGLGVELLGDGFHYVDGVAVGFEKLLAVAPHVGVNVDDPPAEDAGHGDSDAKAGKGPDNEALPGVRHMDGFGRVVGGDGVEFVLGHGWG